MRFRDPVTGDELSLGEQVSWVIQGIIRRWVVLVVVTLLTIFAWVHGRIWTHGLTDIWNLGASYWAILIESVVGIAMFSQTRRDAVILRAIKRIEEHVEGLVEEEEEEVGELVRAVDPEMSAKLDAILKGIERLAIQGESLMEGGG